MAKVILAEGQEMQEMVFYKSKNFPYATSLIDNTGKTIFLNENSQVIGFQQSGIKYLAKEPVLLSGFWDRLVDTIGDGIINVINVPVKAFEAGGNIVQATGQTATGVIQTAGTAGQQIIQGVGVGVGQFAQDPRNLMMVGGAIAGMPMLPGMFGPGGGGQGQNFLPQPNRNTNLLLIGLGLAAFLILKNK